MYNLCFDLHTTSLATNHKSSVPKTGAATGGPYGAAAGFLLGTANWGWGLADKVLGTNSKNDLYNKAEQGLGTVYDSFENSAKNYLNFLGKLAGA